MANDPDDLISVIRQIPPVTRFILFSFVGVSIPVFMHAVPAMIGVPFSYDLVFHHFQVSYYLYKLH